MLRVGGSQGLRVLERGQVFEDSLSPRRHDVLPVPLAKVGVEQRECPSPAGDGARAPLEAVLAAAGTVELMQPRARASRGTSCRSTAAARSFAASSPRMRGKSWSCMSTSLAEASTWQLLAAVSS